MLLSNDGGISLCPFKNLLTWQNKWVKNSFQPFLFLKIILSVKFLVTTPCHSVSRHLKDTCILQSNDGSE